MPDLEHLSETGQRLLNDLAFAAPEIWWLHIERRLAEAREEGYALAKADIPVHPSYLDLLMKPKNEY